MEIVLCNLLSNAFKHSPEGSKIELGLNYIDRSHTSQNAYCEIKVKDNGKGMPKEFLDKIFDRFYQITKADSVLMIGTGIGLSLVKNIVELHHGAIEVESEPGKGSLFLIRLPAGKKHFSSEQIISDFRNSEDPGHYRIDQAKEELMASIATEGRMSKNGSLPEMLLVEDNPDIRTFVRQLFKNDFHIFEAINGWQGLEIALKKLPDIIISDIMMPELDGLGLCTHLKEDEKTSHIPIILLTARTDNVFKVEGYASGADAYVTKPFDPEVLKAQTHGLLNARQKLKDYYSKKITLQPSDIEITSLDEEFIKKAIQVVEQNLQNPDFSTQTLAQEVAMSQSTLYRKIKALTGDSVNAFIRSVRIKRAAQYLQESQLNISEIAYKVGFGDVKYFRKCFRKQFEMSPTDYIKSSLGKAEIMNGRPT